MVSLRQAEDGKVPPAQLQLDIHAVGDLLAPPQGLFLAGKGGVHLLGAAEIELVAVHPHAVGVGAELARVHAQQHVLGLGVLAEHVMDVAGGHQGQAHAVGQVDGRLHGHALDFQVVVLDLDEVAVAEELVEPGGRLPGLLQVGLAAGQQQAVQLAGNAAAQADNALVVGLQQLAVDARLEIESLPKKPATRASTGFESRCDWRPAA